MRFGLSRTLNELAAHAACGRGFTGLSLSLLIRQAFTIFGPLAPAVAAGQTRGALLLSSRVRHAARSSCRRGSDTQRAPAVVAGQKRGAASTGAASTLVRRPSIHGLVFEPVAPAVFDRAFTGL